MKWIITVIVIAAFNCFGAMIIIKPKPWAIKTAAGGGDAPVLVNATTPNRDNASDNPETWSATTSLLGVGGYITLEFTVYGADGPGTVSIDGSAMTRIHGITNASDNNLKTWIYGLAVGAKAAGTYTASVAGFNGRQFVGAVRTWNNVHQTTPTGTANVAGGSSTAATVDITSATGELVIDCIGADDTTLTAGAGQTEDANNNDAGTNVDLATSHENGASTVTMSWTLSASAAWNVVGVSLKPLL